MTGTLQLQPAPSSATPQAKPFEQATEAAHILDAENRRSRALPRKSVYYQDLIISNSNSTYTWDAGITVDVPALGFVMIYVEVWCRNDGSVGNTGCGTYIRETAGNLGGTRGEDGSDSGGSGDIPDPIKIIEVAAPGIELVRGVTDSANLYNGAAPPRAGWLMFPASEGTRQYQLGYKAVGGSGPNADYCYWTNRYIHAMVL